ncbi:hypothetical protein NECAME_08533 [Necator americanus]|uniref:Uncharacterized protein n=1 Tax=Necator americanus TaxID=51031 RepID=W2TIJ6_NECAM|nr:hypothetical protein NECAME_08533 [Necator americanus]ETN81404.1 hypothetical protein NECAME_08533 [Necator americanus]
MDATRESPSLDRRKNEINDVEFSSDLLLSSVDLRVVLANCCRDSIEKEAEEYEQMDSIALDNSQHSEHDSALSGPLESG